MPNPVYVFILAGLAFGGGMAVIGFGGFLVAWFHRMLGSPLPLPTLHNSHEARVYIGVGLVGFAIWAGTFLVSLRVT